jgi:serine/threonine protein kinase
MAKTQTSNWTGKSIANGRFAVGELLGEGGMGRVYRARDHKNDRDVVIKVPHVVLLRDPEFVERFQREVESVRKLVHPHIVPVLCGGIHQGVPFVVQRYMPGGSLAEKIESTSLDDRIAHLGTWLPQIADALDFVHDQGFIHRDIKPDNIFLDKRGRAYLGDFGIIKASSEVSGSGGGSRLTMTGAVVGTPEYMAPEMAMGEDYDHRSDQYSLAVTVYECLNGAPPFQGPTPAAVLVQLTTTEVPDIRTNASWIPDHFATAITRALARSTANRFASCTEFSNAFQRPAQVPVATKPASSVLVKVQCPGCSTVLKVKPDHVGRKVKCPTCRIGLSVVHEHDEQNLASGQSTISIAAAVTDTTIAVPCGIQKECVAQLTPATNSDRPSTDSLPANPVASSITLTRWFVSGRPFSKRRIAGVVCTAILTIVCLVSYLRRDARRAETTTTIDTAEQTATADAQLRVVPSDTSVPTHEDEHGQAAEAPLSTVAANRRDSFRPSNIAAVPATETPATLPAVIASKPTEVVATTNSTTSTRPPTQEVVDNSETEFQALLNRRRQAAESEQELLQKRAEIDALINGAQAEFNQTQFLANQLTTAMSRADATGRDLQNAIKFAQTLSQRIDLERQYNTVKSQYEFNAAQLRTLQVTGKNQLDKLKIEQAKLNAQIAKEQAVHADIARGRREWFSMATRIGPLGNGDSETAIRRDTEWLRHDPEYPATLVSRALALGIGAQEYGQARRDTAAILRQFPNSAEALAISAFIDGRQRDHVKARDQFQKARLRKQNPSLVFTLEWSVPSGNRQLEPCKG